MSTRPSSQRPDPRMNPRLAEQLADRALDGLSPADQAALLREAGVDAVDITPEDVAAAQVELAFLDPSSVSAMPEDAKQRLIASGEAWSRGSAGAAASSMDPIPFRASPESRGTRWRMLPWLVAAACVVVALYTMIPSVQPDPRTSRDALLATAGDTVTMAWSDWDKPEVAGVQGDVVWSESKQQGFLHFTNLRRNDPTVEQYQLWIIDSRGMNQRISGAIFNGAQGELVVPIDPGIRVQGAAAFAVTIEKPGGTWVSDMTRRVVIASK